MIRFFYITLALVCCTLFTACSNDDGVAVSDTDTQVMAIVPAKKLYIDGAADDARQRITRSILEYDKRNVEMNFRWTENDVIGVFNVGGIANNDADASSARTRATEDSQIGESSEGSSDVDQEVDENEEQIKKINTQFNFKGNIVNDGSSSTARFSNDDFYFDLTKYWVAYCPYKPIIDGEGVKPLTRDDIKISYRGQTALSNGTPNGGKPSQNSTQESETKASSHLGAYDYLISDPTMPAPVGATTFYFKHLGSTLRLYMQFPEGAFGGTGKTAKIKSLKVLTPGKNIMVSDATLKINPNPRGDKPSYSVVSKTMTDNMELKFTGDDGTGIEVPDNGFFITYMEFFPTTIPAESAILHITAEVNGVERYFKSKWMTAVTINPGFLYQWTAKQYEEIIELTATLQSWQDIVSGNISTEE